MLLLQVQHHLLCVWADANPNAQLQCLSQKPTIVLQTTKHLLVVTDIHAGDVAGTASLAVGVG